MKKCILILLMMVGMAVPGFSQMVEHVVDKGETFASIAQKYGMTEQQLKEANPKYRGVFYVGMTLNIPQKYANASSATPQAQPSPEPQQETTAPKQTEAPNLRITREIQIRKAALMGMVPCILSQYMMVRLLRRNLRAHGRKEPQ